jgi:hypothetical protein
VEITGSWTGLGSDIRPGNDLFGGNCGIRGKKNTVGRSVACDSTNFHADMNIANTTPEIGSHWIVSHSWIGKKHGQNSN